MPRVISPEAAVAQGISPASLRQVAAWKYEAAARAAKGWTEGADFAAPDRDTADRHRADAKALMQAAQEVERLNGRKSRRRQARDERRAA